MPLSRRHRSAADGVSLPASAREGTFSHRPSAIQATTSQTHSTLTPWRSDIHAVCFSTRCRSACAEYNLFPIKSIARGLTAVHAVQEVIRAQVDDVWAL